MPLWQFVAGRIVGNATLCRKDVLLPVRGDLLIRFARAWFNTVRVADTVRQYISRAFVRIAAAALGIADQLQPEAAGFTSPLDSTRPMITATEQTAPAAPVLLSLLIANPLHSFAAAILTNLEIKVHQPGEEGKTAHQERQSPPTAPVNSYPIDE